MSLNANLTGLGVWELVYFKKLVGDKENRKRGLPYIFPVEIPYLPESRIFIVGASSLKAKPTWYRAGYFHQEIDGVKVDDTVVFEGLGRVPSISVDATTEVIPLNVVKLIVFPKLANSYRLRFESVPWLEELNLAIWEYTGVESESTEDLLEAVRAKLEVLEFKIDQL